MSSLVGIKVNVNLKQNYQTKNCNVCLIIGVVFEVKRSGGEDILLPQATFDSFLHWEHDGLPSFLDEYSRLQEWVDIASEVSCKTEKQNKIKTK